MDLFSLVLSFKFVNVCKENGPCHSTNKNYVKGDTNYKNLYKFFVKRSKRMSL